MPTSVYKNKKMLLFNGTEIYLTPLKLKYFRELLDIFKDIHNTKNEDEAIEILTKCIVVCMQQYDSNKKYIIDDIEDNFNIPMIYEMLDIAADIEIKKREDKTVKEETEGSKSSWDDLDLAKLESEVFLLGIWKDYEDLETSLSMPELLTTLNAKRELEYEQNKFLAAIQGVDIESESSESRGQKEWEDLKARVFSKGQTNNGDDVVALQGQNAINAGFGIGMGLDYEDLRN